MRTTIRIEGNERLSRALDRLSDDAKARVSLAVEATGIELRGEIVKKYQRGPASGIVYEKTNPTRTHQASAPGEAPATDTGRLANSVTFSKTGQLSAEVGTEVEYGAWLEFGTRRIRPRPNWIPSVQAAGDKFIRRLTAAIRGATR
jgi:phage gpG-like protein